MAGGPFPVQKMTVFHGFFRVFTRYPHSVWEADAAWQIPSVGLPQGHVDLLMLIVARGYGKRHSSRVTHFAASAVPEAVV
jgi:hypothetical protein